MEILRSRQTSHSHVMTTISIHLKLDIVDLNASMWLAREQVDISSDLDYKLTYQGIDCKMITLCGEFLVYGNEKCWFCRC